MHEMTALVRDLSREEREALINAAQRALRELGRGYQIARGGWSNGIMNDNGKNDIHAQLPVLFGATATLDLCSALGRCQERLTLFETACRIEEEERRRAGDSKES